jgi:LmbE family N-acetylglucosaminyl deacetylase
MSGAPGGGGARHLLPPGETTRVVARRVLVVAPHADDEVLGCGGLLAQLAADGARVRVLFLTDGAAAAPAGGKGAGAETGRAYAERRRAESALALAALGAGTEAEGRLEAEHLELPDGRLAGHLDEAAEAIRRALAELEPDLLLAPSPLEATSDHRAAFAALHRALGGVRRRQGGAAEPLAAVAAGLEVLLYEVNHPGYPDVLVDVSRELPQIEAAMACYASQQERHDYLAAGLGLRRYRTLSLPAGAAAAGPAGAERVSAAEGYRRLAAADFASHGPASLVRRLGGVPELLEVREGPPVSVIVRTRDRPGLLAEALASLAAGTYRRVEVVLVNDGGAPPELPAGYPFPVRRVDLPENRGRAAAANAGVAAATGEWIAFLDDDDRAEPEHLAVLAGAASGGGFGSGARAVYSDAAVVAYELAGDADPGAPGGWREVERRLPYSRDFDPDLLVLDNYIPFNTVLVERELFEELAATGGGAAGPFDPSLPIFEDWDLLIRLSRRVPLHHLRRVTCEYRHFRGAVHHALGERPRERADFLAVKARVLAKHAGLLAPDLLARAVDTLRAEAVDLAEEVAGARAESARERAEAARARDEAAAERRARGRLEERYHRLNGEVVSLREERAARAAELEQAGAELRRLHGREQELVAAVEEQTAHIGRTYGEIERLNAVLRELQGASLPGIVRWWRDQRRKA